MTSDRWPHMLDDRPKSAQPRSVCFGSSKRQLPSSCLHLFPRYGCSWRKRVVTWESIQISRRVGGSLLILLIQNVVWKMTWHALTNSRWLQSLPKFVAVGLYVQCNATRWQQQDLNMSHSASFSKVSHSEFFQPCLSPYRTGHFTGRHPRTQWLQHASAGGMLGYCGIVLASTLFHFCGTYSSYPPSHLLYFQTANSDSWWLVWLARVKLAGAPDLEFFQGLGCHQELDAAVLAIFQETNSSAASGSIRNLFEEWAHHGHGANERTLFGIPKCCRIHSKSSRSLYIYLSLGVAHPFASYFWVFDRYQCPCMKTGQWITQKCVFLESNIAFVLEVMPISRVCHVWKSHITYQNISNK